VPARSLSHAERMHALVGPSPTRLIREKGLTRTQAQALENAWDHWDAEHGPAWRLAAGLAAPFDRKQLSEMEDVPNPITPPDPRALDLA
jgi:hypothetical protein